MTALVSASALLGAALFACGGSPRATESDAAARIVAQAIARPANVPVGMPFDVELTATNVTSVPIGLTLTSGCAFSYEIQTANGRVVVAPTYPCTTVIRSLTLASGAVLLETYRYEIGEALLPRLAPGVYRIVPTLNLGDIPGLIIRGVSVEVR